MVWPSAVSANFRLPRAPCTAHTPVSGAFLAGRGCRGLALQRSEDVFAY